MLKTNRKVLCTMIVIISLSMVFVLSSCNKNDDANTSFQSEQSSESSSSSTASASSSETESSTEVDRSNTVLTEFVVEIYPAWNSEEPPEDPMVSFTMELPANWVAAPADPTNNQYAFGVRGKEDQEGRSYVALIQGGRQVENPEKPFELATQDVTQDEFDRGAVQEIDILDYPVLRHVYAVEEMSGEYDIVDRQTIGYYIYINGGLIEIQLTTFEDVPLTLEQQENFDAIIASFKLI